MADELERAEADLAAAFRRCWWCSHEEGAHATVQHSGPLCFVPGCSCEGYAPKGEAAVDGSP